MTENDIPRRIRLDLHTPAEAAISAAMAAVEEAGTHPHLTRAVVLLGQARDAAADFFDGVPVADPLPPVPIDITKRLRDTLAQVVGSDDPEELQAMRLLLSDAKEKGGDIDDGVLAAIDVLLETSVETSEPAPSLQQRARAWGSPRAEPYSDHDGLQIFSLLEAISFLIYRALHPRPHLWRAQGDARQTSVLVDAAIALLTIADLREFDLVAEIEKRIAK